VLRKRGERTGRGKDTHKLTSQARILYIIISEEERRIDRLIFTFKNSRICFSSHTQRVERREEKERVLHVIGYGFCLFCLGRLAYTQEGLTYCVVVICLPTYRPNSPTISLPNSQY